MIFAAPAVGGIVWVLDNWLSETDGALQSATILRAYDAINLAKTLYSSDALAANAAGDAVKFTIPVIPSVNLIRSYAEHELRINDERFHDSVIVSAKNILAEPALVTVADLASSHAVRILALEPEVVLLGSGRRQIFPATWFGAEFLRAGIGFEVMDTGAACRTYNVLVAEQRRVVAVLILSSG